MVKWATCVELSSEDSWIEKKNMELAAATGLALVEPGSLKFASLACSHTNAGLRAINARLPSQCRLLSEDGHLSIEKLQRCDEKMARACTHGLPWRVLKATVRVQYPDILRIIQARLVCAGGPAQEQITVDYCRSACGPRAWKLDCFGNWSHVSTVQRHVQRCRHLTLIARGQRLPLQYCHPPMLELFALLPGSELRQPPKAPSI
jgi:hypothetical protein